jgi:osmotically-inducible protein OsmY
MKKSAHVPGDSQPNDSVQRRILNEVEMRLRESYFLALRCLTCHFDHGIATLSGRVPTFYTKQVALSVAAKVPGVDEVVDRISVD